MVDMDQAVDVMSFKMERSNDGENVGGEGGSWELGVGSVGSRAGEIRSGSWCGGSWMRCVREGEDGQADWRGERGGEERVEWGFYGRRRSMTRNGVICCKGEKRDARAVDTSDGEGNGEGEAKGWRREGEVENR